MLTAYAIATQENLLELMDQSKEGREILNAIYLELHTDLGKRSTGAARKHSAPVGSIKSVLTTAKQNAAKSELRQRQRNRRLVNRCKADRTTLHRHVNENERHEFTVNRHLNANRHALRKNQQFIDRSKGELNNYTALGNLIKANRAHWNKFVHSRMQKMGHVVKLLRKVRRHLINAHKAAMGSEFIEMKPEVNAALAELRVEFTNTEEDFDGLRPVIANLLQSCAQPRVVGKNVLRARLIRLLRGVIKFIRKRRDKLEQHHEAAHAVFEALLKSFDENKTRVQKLVVRLAHEKSLLNKRQGALRDALRRAHVISHLSHRIERMRIRQCRRNKVRNARLHVALQKVKNIVAQITEILQERFGTLRHFFIERKMKFEEKH